MSLIQRDRLRHARAPKAGEDGHADHRRHRVTVPEGTSIMRGRAGGGAADPKALRHRHGGGLRFLPALPGRDRRPHRHAGVLHRRRLPTAWWCRPRPSG